MKKRGGSNKKKLKKRLNQALNYPFYSKIGSELEIILKSRFLLSNFWTLSFSAREMRVFG